MLTVAVTNLKGGTGKSTSTGFLAHVWHERGRRVLVVDADPQGTVSRWADDAEWSIPVVRLDTPKLHQRLDKIIPPDIDVVLVDTDSTPPIVAAALRVATHAVVPVPPNAVDQERLPELQGILEDTAALRLDGQPPVTAAMLTRADGRTAAHAVYRDVMTAAGWHVLRAEARAVQQFAQAVGSPIVRAAATAYGDAVDELETLRQVAR
ncbi:Chromosome (plasmid) partitioning protein ParA [Pseudonocardia sp. Ae168_Ps1]|uniref:ParA family protein n=1 Tax=unclassified Pseudonocardia TaxID=2619320 RepID=UPI00094B14E5|nr:MULTISPECIES: ParA family protein [unclassified Pseudonocardia]OLL69825.1 Chromosome (plasmid) partitioning protein ParA [Pseudonocardia sp. Ae150A_Ps1]OLL69957.1 Chromosome (plasmid) partitioning protein ParA [Pseudonocardia sp. Ae168_Ps1]OLL89118.1 Chromosome (plasmid) partitioning protein ParA [Pseudonocardia sp. Ae356_Ps1]